jgi:hypothetical protein
MRSLSGKNVKAPTLYSDAHGELMKGQDAIMLANEPQPLNNVIGPKFGIGRDPRSVAPENFTTQQCRRAQLRAAFLASPERESGRFCLDIVCGIPNILVAAHRPPHAGLELG